MRTLLASLILLSGTLSCSHEQPKPPLPLTVRNPSAVPALRCGREGKKPVEVRVDELIGGHLALTLVYPSLDQQFKYLIEEVRTLRTGRKAMAGHKLRNNDGKSAWVEPASSFVFFSGTPPRTDNLNSTYQFVDSVPQVELDLETGTETETGKRAMSVYLRCENLDQFLDALAAQ